MAVAKDGPSVTAYFGDSNSCLKHAMFAIDVAAALQGPDRAKWATSAQSSVVHDMTKPAQFRDK
jgi:hypothetical protein